MSLQAPRRRPATISEPHAYAHASDIPDHSIANPKGTPHCLMPRALVPSSYRSSSAATTLIEPMIATMSLSRCPSVIFWITE